MPDFLSMSEEAKHRQCAGGRIPAKGVDFYAPNCDRISCRILRRRGYAGQVVFAGFSPSCPHSDRKKATNCRAWVVGP